MNSSPQSEQQQPPEQHQQPEQQPPEQHQQPEQLQPEEQPEQQQQPEGEEPKGPVGTQRDQLNRIPHTPAIGEFFPNGNEVPTTVFLRELVCVPQVFSAKRKQFELIEEWPRMSSLVPYWFLPEDNPDGMDLEEYNMSIARANKWLDFAWLIKGVRAVKIATFRKEMREVCHISWGKCWIPITSINERSHPQMRLSLERQKAKYASLPPRRQARSKRFAESQVYRFLASLKSSPWKPFYVYEVIDYAVITGLEVREAVLVRFADTYEHCSSMVTSKELWCDVNQRRVEAATAFLRPDRNELEEWERKLVLEYLMVATEHYELLKK